MTASTPESQTAQTLVDEIQEVVAEAAQNFSEQTASISAQNSTSDIPTADEQTVSRCLVVALLVCLMVGLCMFSV